MVNVRFCFILMRLSSLKFEVSTGCNEIVKSCNETLLDEAIADPVNGDDVLRR